MLLGLQYFGGRGAGSGVRGNTGGMGGNFGSLKELPLAGQTAFDEGKNTNPQMTTNAWNTKNASLDHEQLLIVNEDGFAVAYFDGDKDSVAFRIPRAYDSKEKKATLTITHVHPPYYDRTIGGTFSDADMVNHIRLGVKETQATSIEGTYRFATTSESNPRGMLNAIKSRSTEVRKAYDKAVGQLSKQGIKLEGKEATDFYLRVADSWTRNTAYKYGYEYELVKR